MTTLYTTDYLEYCLTLVSWIVHNGIWAVLVHPAGAGRDLSAFRAVSANAIFFLRMSKQRKARAKTATWA
ncbi:hypothetical protein [Burkholderia cepacia]|uniref:hypothetical protein n=1 Tax=Burkholderia TaxID=32008 RepID=UPI000754B00D|nr:hypothetical protein [Burkholderia cepacia]EMD9443462.1 hypothetical protein [Burkholderia cepacia]KVW80319.1 hypothetical protein WL00_30660 [Burkholderia cepacia]KVX70364.1 hypothetical protein WL07_19695 [Burkholderia cepacia]